jgi:thiol-disulfide isomerase/thioredoxin
MKKIIYIIIGLLIIAGIVWIFVTPGRNTPGKYDAFAKCIAASGTKFYGAFWCPHCQAQKALFGKSSKYLPYIECSTPDGRSETAVCRNAGITGFPTWQFGESTTTRVEGEVSLSNLASSTGCVLPE